MSEKTCCVCGETENDEKGNLRLCSQDHFENIKVFASSWSKFGFHSELYEKLLRDNWTDGKISYHNPCYSKVTHKSNLSKAKKRHDRIADEQPNKTQKTFDSGLCVICQETKKGVASKVSTERVAESILRLKITASALQHRLTPYNTTEDIFENGISYHSACLFNENRKAATAMKNQNESVSVEVVFDDINDDFVRLVKRELIAEGATIDMNQLVHRYEQLCEEAGCCMPATSMKPYIKSVIEGDEDLVTKIDFYQYAPNKPAVLANKKTVSKLVCQKHFRENEEKKTDHSKEISKEIRNELAAIKNWEFSGTFEDFKMPPKLSQLVKSIISDRKSLSKLKQNEIDSATCNIVQHIYSNFKSDRQLNYNSSVDRGFEKHRLTPLSVGLALVNYKDNRSKKEIEFLSEIGLSINYDKLQRILTSVATTAVEVASQNNLGIILPSSFKKGIRPIFAADNIDIGGDVSSFHGADLMIAQANNTSCESIFPEFSFNMKSERSLKLSLAPEIDENVVLSDDMDIKFSTSISLQNTQQHSERFEQLNIIWLLLSQSKLTLTQPQDVDDQKNEYQPKDSSSFKSLSWSAFHSCLLETNSSIQNVAIVAPLYRRSPTQVPILMDILKRASNISALIVGENKRTIITLDGDLYGRAVRIPNYKDRWIIRLGSLHTVIAALKCLGKYIEGSGIDVAWESSEMYGSATVNQIIEGRHIYRGIQAHTITLMALFHLKLHSDIFTDQDRQMFQSKIRAVECELSTMDKNSFTDAIMNLQEDFVSTQLFDKLQTRNLERQTSMFLNNYTAQIMNMLNYIGATRTRNWLQHLSTKEEMEIYFHAHDLPNYSKWSALYVADMLELETNDPESWKFLSDGNFTVTTNSCPFTSIDPDHAIEHQHKVIKSGRGLSDIKDNESALERFALIIPLLSNMVEEYKRYSNIKPNNGKELMHHESVGNFFSIQLKSSQALVACLSREGNPYEYVDLRNLTTFSVPRTSICDHVCERDSLGEKALRKFRLDRMLRTINSDDELGDETIRIPFWSPLKQNKLEMFSDIHITVNGKHKIVTTMRKEKQLYSRMLYVMKARPELCMEKVIGEYEFTSVPPSNFGPDGSMIMSKSHDTLINMIMKLKSQEDEISVYEMSTDEDSVIIIDAMDVIEAIKKRKPMVNVSDLVNHFVTELKKRADGYSEVRIVFKRFERSPLNDSRCSNKTLKKVPVHYHVNNSTPIKNIDSFLAHVKTQTELTIFLGQKVTEHYKHSTIKCLTAYENKYFVNKTLEGFTGLGKEHNFPDMKQIILSNVADVAINNKIRTLTIRSNDVDLPILLVGLFHHIPPYTTVKTDKSCTEIINLYNRLGVKLSDAIIGWYAFYGMKHQGTFYGKGVKTQFGAFLKADDDIICAFSEFGNSLQFPENLMVQMERFVCMLYNKNLKSIKDIRCIMSGEGKDANQLPPTLGTLVPHTSRAYYQALTFKMSVHPAPEFPPPTDYHWATQEEDFVPVMCLNPPAPDAIIELKKCGCAKSDCSRQSCKCRKNNLVCSALCKCGDGCTNRRKDHDECEELNDDDLSLNNF